MLHLISLILMILLAWQTVILACRLSWLAVLLMAFCFMTVVTGVLAVALGCQKLVQWLDDWNWKRRYGEVLPPELGRFPD
jgi:hypothetical protein